MSASTTRRRGESVAYTDRQGVKRTDTIARVVILKPYSGHGKTARWYVLKNLGLMVAATDLA